MGAMPSRGIFIGIGLQLAAFITAYLSLRFLYSMGWFGCLVISVPLFIASLFFILRAEGPIWVRLLLTFWILGIPLSSAAQTAWERLHLRTEIVLVPAGYVGKGIVRFSDPAGKPQEVEDGKLVLRLDANGELRTQAHQQKFESDLAFSTYGERREFYYVEPTGNRIRIDSITVNNAPERSGVIPLGTAYDAGRIVSIDFFVGTSAQWSKSMENR